VLNLIRVFIKVVEVGSFSRAGVVLKMAPSSVARNIDTLEDELQITLFKRSTRQLVLTDEGNTFLEGAGRLLSDADTLVSSLRHSNEEPEGILKISVFESFGRLYLCPILPEFLQRYPKVKIEFDLENRMIDLFSEDVDLAIRIGRPEDSGLKARVLLPNHTRVCASPDYISRHGMPLKPADLEQHNCLVLSQNRQVVNWYFKKGAQHKKIAVRGNLSSKGGTPLLEAVISGVGVVQLSNWMIDDAVREKKLVVCLPEWESSLHESTSGEVYAVYKGSKFPKPVIRAFIDFLVEKNQSKDLADYDA
jgi:DNA-binding transcriptional LysR family regulator